MMIDEMLKRRAREGQDWGHWAQGEEGSVDVVGDESQFGCGQATAAVKNHISYSYMSRQKQGGHY